MYTGAQQRMMRPRTEVYLSVSQDHQSLSVSIMRPRTEGT
jgi:hypothetical protein